MLLDNGVQPPIKEEQDEEDVTDSLASSCNWTNGYLVPRKAL